ncbi:EpsG family protein [Virgibacillus sp. NKC19-16]|uniref:EpsG family protein n=1 Tax=Virgibacillus salidurans TaxID=2831673 RepID=UPI001F435824|nr:EpsG family protein [Virgibacillus sp. NKC19-16]UJL45811.1 EpsG family protein [Virgibacillus sp. NKC19-16]
MTNEMWSGLLFYAAIAAVTAAFADLSVRRSSKPLNIFFTILAILTPSLFAGLRYGIGTDYSNYLEGFFEINSPIFDVDTEYLFLGINKIVGYLGLDFQFVLFITSFITTLFIYLALKRYKASLNIGIGMFVYMMMYYQISFNAIQQIAAMAILLFSIHYINERKFIKFTLLVVIAVGFHETAILFYPLYFLHFLYGTSKHTLLKVLSFSGLIVLMINFSAVLFPIASSIDSLSYYANSYLDSDREFELGLGILFRTLPFIIAGIIFRKDIKSNKDMIFIFNVVIIGCISLLTSYGSVNFTERISYYFLSSLIIFVPFIYRLSAIKKKRYIGFLVIFSVIGLWFMDFIYLGRNETIPYEWILNN